MFWAHLWAMLQQVFEVAKWLGLAAFWIGGLYSLGRTFKDQNGGRYPLWIYVFLAGAGFLGGTIFGVTTDGLPRTVGLISLGLFAICWLTAVVMILLPKRKEAPPVPDYGTEREGVWPPPPKSPRGE